MISCTSSARNIFATHVSADHTNKLSLSLAFALVLACSFERN